MTKQTLTLASLALLAQAAPASEALNQPGNETTRQTLNAASVQAIHGSWIKVSPACKDRSFPFKPVPVAAAERSQDVQQLFADLDASVGA